jgi:AraC-like DNA-binding protein/ligand-binding sensor protein
MKAPEYRALCQSRSARNTLRAFSELTNMAVKLAPTNPRPKDRFFECQVSPLCRLIARTGMGKTACRHFLERLQSQLERRRSSCAVCCFAGLTELAVPVLVAGLPVATLLCGGSLRRKRSERDFARCLERLRQANIRLDRTCARKAYNRTAVLSTARIRAARQLLLTLAQHLGELASHCLLARCAQDPPCVACAKVFAQAHLAGAVKTRDAAHEAHVTEEYFCRVFKAATGMTFSEYVARARVEQAKQLLANPALRVTDVAFAAGFQSIPHFNHVFKRHNGTSPKQYRARLAAKADSL